MDEKATVQEIWEILKQTTLERQAFQKEAAERAREFDERMNREAEERRKEAEKRAREFDEKMDREAEERRKEAKERAREFDEKMDRESAELRKAIKATNVKLEKYGLVQGEIAEDLFRRNIAALLAKKGIEIDEVYGNTKGKLGREYDVIAANGTKVVVLEAKNKMRPDDLKDFLEKRLPAFKKNFPRFADKEVHGALGALSFKSQLERDALKKGLFVFTQGENENAAVKSPVKLLTL